MLFGGVGWIAISLLLGQICCSPASYLDSAVVSGLNQRLASHSRFQEPGVQASPGGEPRLPLPSLPSPQEFEAIKKVAQILVMLGEQVIPTIIGDNPPRPNNINNCDPPSSPAEDVPNDPVNEK